MKINKNTNLPLDKFIEFALYDKDTGYYMKKNPFGKEGDFITAPNITRLFSEMIAIWIVSFWKSIGSQKKFNLLELGCLLYTSPSPRDQRGSRMPSSA